MTYAVASLKYNGSDDHKNESTTYVKKGSSCEKQPSPAKSKNDACTSEGAAPQKDVLKSNVLEDFNNISKYNVELDDENNNTETRQELVDEVMKKHESMATPSKELNDLLEGNGTKSNYRPDPAFNNDFDEVEEEEEEEKEEEKEEDEEGDECDDEEVVVEKVSEEDDDNRDINNDDLYQ